MAAEFSLLGPGPSLGGTDPADLPHPERQRDAAAARRRDARCSAACCRTARSRPSRGIIGLQSIPILNRILTGTQQGRKRQTEILFSITPHLVRAPKITEEDLRRCSSGRRRSCACPAARPAVRRARSRRPLRRGAPSPAPPPGPSTGRPPGTVSPPCPKRTRCARPPRRLRRPDGGADAVARPRAGHRAHAAPGNPGAVAGSRALAGRPRRRARLAPAVLPVHAARAAGAAPSAGPPGP